ncbi:esterase, PHB depolymerase family [Hartmannibacter diazotrophicus]|uniref:Esterase, PHB depolymerase family n=1 Tax=Hartmannibacter diazotrophicus TaxID=1482074 RepID=A0A2C9DCW6_9HYPH|nr:PHB depolymerase family esterase [Hartmannibacter diazotrophicus]SON58009.1 esterase, PHB depolymerase family [Hartmannibacter diazotrophicus]
MRSLADTIARLTRFRRAADAIAAAGPPPGQGRLEPFRAFEPNPGSLRAHVFRPDGLPPGAPLLLVLHGCLQDAASYDRGSGWSALAGRHGFGLVYAEQRIRNNRNRCFNWFEVQDQIAEGGEAESIRRMVEAVADDYGSDRRRIFVTGLSAGGAMTAVMLATAPDLFSGGAIIAGVPYGVARSVPEAFDRMRGIGLPDEAELQRRLAEASGHSGAWPMLSIWQGDRDETVSPVNAEAIIDQFRAVLGLPATPAKVETSDGYRRRVWRNGMGRAVLEEYRITGMGHGTPLAPRADGLGGIPGPFMLDAGIWSSEAIGRFFGIVPQERRPQSGLPNWLTALWAKAFGGQ